MLFLDTGSSAIVTLLLTDRDELHWSNENSERWTEQLRSVSKAEGFDGDPIRMGDLLTHESAQEAGFDRGNCDWIWRMCGAGQGQRSKVKLNSEEK